MVFSDECSSSVDECFDARSTYCWQHDNFESKCKPNQIRCQRILNVDQVTEIFLQKPKNERPDPKNSSRALARMYGVSAKTVRDIWCGRTWHRQTIHLDPSRKQRPNVQKGRPLGSKDKVPRQRNRTEYPRCNSFERRLHFSVFVPESAENFDVSSFGTNDPFHADWPHWDRADRFGD